MRDFRDAKAMAHSLRESLTTKAITISHGESLELVSKMLGVADWNTLSALLQADRRDTGIAVAPRQTGTASYPAMPLRDLVPFPTATYPLFVGRIKTMQALDQAFEGQRELVLAVQRESGVDEPGFADVYEIGVLAQLLELERLGDGTLKVLAQVQRRVEIRRFVGEGGGGAFQAEVADISEGPIAEAPELIQQAIKRFETYTEARELRIPQIWPLLAQTRDPGRVADMIATRLALPIRDKQSLLATLDPVARLKQVGELMNFSVPSPTLDATGRRALDYANQRHHQYATLEHLLLALIDDPDAAAVMRSCNADLGALKASLLGYLDNELKHIVIENGGEAKPTAAFQRVAQRATLDAQAWGRSLVTGTHQLLAIFQESRSPAVRFLGEQGVSPGRISDVNTGVGKGA
jgi:ATP-dependent Lon protease